jgi:hypothetical protein
MLPFVHNAAFRPPHASKFAVQRLNKVDATGMLTWVLERIADQKNNKLDELMPWQL